jgi:hypothetical protein
MEKVVIAYAIDEHGKNIVGVYSTPDVAVKMIRKQGYEMTDTEATTLKHLHNTTNLKINFHLETWQVHS